MTLSISKLIRTIFLCLFYIQLLIGQTNEITKTNLYDINGTKYISALEYAKVQNILTIFYEDKEKLEFRFQSVKLTRLKDRPTARCNRLNLSHLNSARA